MQNDLPDTCRWPGHFIIADYTHNMCMHNKNNSNGAEVEQELIIIQISQLCLTMYVYVYYVSCHARAAGQSISTKKE